MRNANRWLILATVATVGLPLPARAGTQLPFNFTSPGGVQLALFCLGPQLRRTGCITIRKEDTRREVYRAEDGAFPVAGHWSCNLYVGTCNSARENVSFCYPGGPDAPPTVELTYDFNNLQVNLSERCASLTATGTLGQTGEADQTPGKDRDGYRFVGGPGEKVTFRLERDGRGGSAGDVATLRVRTPDGAVLAQRRGAVPFTLDATLPGPVGIVVLREPGEGEPFRGAYALTVAPASKAIGTRSLVPAQDVEP
jgi:hypothetical protein